MNKSREKKPLQATNLRLILSIVLILILLGMAGGFYALYLPLKKTSEEVASVQAEAQSANTKLQQLVRLDDELDAYKPAIQKAEQIVADSKSYQYQNQIINDLTHYASQAGVSIRSFNFQTNAAAGATSSSGQSSNTANNNQQSTTSSGGSGLKSTFVSIQLGEGQSYENLLRFIHLIEQNLTRMQISEVSLSRNKENNSVSTQALNIEVYIK